MGFPPQYAESLIFRYFKGYQSLHEKKFPSKGEALAKRWEEFKKLAEAAKSQQKTSPVEETKEPTPV